MALRSWVIQLLNSACLLQILTLPVSVTARWFLLLQEPHSSPFSPVSQWGIGQRGTQVWQISADVAAARGVRTGQGWGEAEQRHIGNTRFRLDGQSQSWLLSLRRVTCQSVISCFIFSGVLDLAGKVRITVGNKQGMDSTGNERYLWKNLIFLTMLYIYSVVDDEDQNKW